MGRVGRVGLVGQVGLVGLVGQVGRVGLVRQVGLVGLVGQVGAGGASRAGGAGRAGGRVGQVGRVGRVRRVRRVGLSVSGTPPARHSGMSQPHENLVAWQRADDLCVMIHRLVRETLPESERFELGKQLRRAAYSVPANIVEGYSHPPGRWRLQYLRIALGSLAELGYGVHLAKRLEYLSDAESAKLTTIIGQAAAPLHGLVKRLSREARSHG